MRKVPVLTAVSLLAICSLAIAPVYAGTAMANDPPSVSLTPGANAPDAFNINDFFVDPTGASITGGSLDAEGSATVDGSASAGVLDYSISAGSESGEAKVWVSADKFGNRPAIDGNNRIVGQTDANWFVNWIVPGSSVSSKAPLGNPGGGSSGTPSGSTGGGGALAASVGEVSLSMEGTWYKRSSGSSTSTGITATIDADGNYTITAAAEASAAIVTFSAGSADAVQVLAAPVVEVGAPVTGSRTVPAGGTDFQVGEAVSVGEYAQLSAYYNASSVDGVAIAVIGFDGVLDGSTVNYSNPSGSGLEAGVLKCLGTSVKSTSGSIIPAIQIFNGGTADITVDIAKFVVADARPLTDYAINPNNVTAEDSLDTIDAIVGDILAVGAVAPVGDAGAMLLNGAGGVSNGTLLAALNKGTAVAECWAQAVGTPDAGSVFVLTVVDGGPTSFATFLPGSSLPTSDWLKVQTMGTIQADLPQAFIVVQAAGLNARVDNLMVRQIDQDDNQFDANLL
jgi:hypothetical protein